MKKQVDFSVLSIRSKIVVTLLVLLVFLIAPDAGSEIGSKALAFIFVACVWFWDRLSK